MVNITQTQTHTLDRRRGQKTQQHWCAAVSSTSPSCCKVTQLHSCMIMTWEEPPEQAWQVIKDRRTTSPLSLTIRYKFCWLGVLWKTDGKTMTCLMNDEPHEAATIDKGCVRKTDQENLKSRAVPAWNCLHAVSPAMLQWCRGFLLTQEV